jgi:LSD1 subclass zinc finger protein
VRLNRSAYALSVQFATFEKVEYLVCGQCKIFAHVLPQYVNGLHNIVCSVCETVHDKFRNDIIAETMELV